MTVGFHSPLPPARTGVADYSAVLLAALKKRGHVEPDARTADVHLYHLGNNQLHRPIYERAIREPGVVVLHDAVLQHFYLGAFDERQYIDEYVFNYGEWERTRAGDLYRDRARSATDIAYFDRPMLRRVADTALVVIVHNPAAEQTVRQHSPNASTVVIPHFYHCPYSPQPDEIRDARARLSIPENAVLFGVFGHLRESKRVFPILEAFRHLQREHPHAALLLAGDFASPDLARALAGELDHPAIFHAPYLPERDFWRTAVAVDCCLNLRYPTAGETSGIGVRLMGLGKPVFFTDGLEIEDIPQDACFRVAAGMDERPELFAYMRAVVELPWIAREIGARAAAHIAHRQSLDHAADKYWNALSAVPRPVRRANRAAGS